jgi:multidrug efflux pump subunit AcrB
VPNRFVEVQRVPRTEPPETEPAVPDPVVVVQGHGWRVTAPLVLLASIVTSIGGLFAGRQTAPVVDQTQAILEMRTETRADIAEIKRTMGAIQDQLRERDNAMSNRVNVIEARLAK